MKNGAPASAGIIVRRLQSALLLFLTIVIFSCAHHYKFPLQQMRMPPAGLNPDQVPQFVVIGNDDVGYSEGIQYLTKLFASHQNPAGNGNDLTFDGKPLHYSFYVNTIYITPKGVEDPEIVKNAWMDAVQHGHEIGVHTHSHPHGRNFTVSQW